MDFFGNQHKESDIMLRSSAFRQSPTGALAPPILNLGTIKNDVEETVKAPKSPAMWVALTRCRRCRAIDEINLGRRFTSNSRTGAADAIWQFLKRSAGISHAATRRLLAPRSWRPKGSPSHNVDSTEKNWPKSHSIEGTFSFPNEQATSPKKIFVATIIWLLVVGVIHEVVSLQISPLGR